MPPHCDSVDGPVVGAAGRALAAGDVDLVLPYVPADAEGEVRAAFDHVLPLQAGSGDAAELARRWFFETVVRVHRAGEHAPYTGLKPAGLDVGPVIPLAERALASGDPEEVHRLLSGELHDQLTRRLAEVRRLEPAAGAPVPEVRAYVQAALGFQVYANDLLRALRSVPHGEGHEH